MGIKLIKKTSKGRTASESLKMREGQYYSYFILRKGTKEKDIEKIIDTFENVVLDSNQTVESTALPEDQISIDIYGKMAPVEVSRALTIIRQCNSSYVELAINRGG